ALELGNQLFGFGKLGISVVEAQAWSVEHQLEAQHLGRIVPVLGHYAFVTSCPRTRQAVAAEAQPAAIENEILVNTELGIPLDIVLVIFAATTGHEDFECEVEPLALFSDHPTLPLVRFHVRHREHIRRKHALSGVIYRQLASQIDPPPYALEETPERLASADLGIEMRVAFRRLGLTRLELRRQTVDNPRALGGTELLPDLERRCPGIFWIHDPWFRTLRHAPYCIPDLVNAPPGTAPGRLRAQNPPTNQ